ncbi:MAG: FkbM family methyltransferase [Fulvivirga sp.]|uniref:FkbM family methyltransferase n=1 Tax=Fulvivirga sp. TaxID=1931237 RepID=UPI0032EB5562
MNSDRILRYFSKRFNRIVRRKVGEKYYQIPIIYGASVPSSNKHEPWFYDLISYLINSKSSFTFFDVGVNLGQTLLKVKSINSSCSYFGFEPNSFCNFYVNKLVRLNGLKNSKVFPFGLSAKMGIEYLHFFNDSDADNEASIIKQFRDNFKRETVLPVPTFTLDYFCDTNEISKIDFLKIDVEGAELEVIKGGISAIRRFDPIIIVEVLPAYNSDNMYRVRRQGELLSIIIELGYNIFQVIKESSQLKGIKKVSKFKIDRQLHECDYVLVKNDQHLPEQLILID